MNEHDLEQAFREWASEDADVQEPARLRERVMGVPDAAVSAPRWQWPSVLKWLRARPLAASTTAAAVLALFALVLLPVLLFGPADEEGPASPEATIVVAADGSGQYLTIAEAVDAADDGDIILVRPGTYIESIVIDKDITITGDGPREAVIVEVRENGPQTTYYYDSSVYGLELYGHRVPYVFVLDDADATLSHVTIRGPYEALAVDVRGGAPLIDDVAIELADKTTSMATDSHVGITFSGGTTATLRASNVDGWLGVMDRSSPSIVSNTLTCNVHLGGDGSSPVLMDNAIIGDDGCN